MDSQRKEALLSYLETLDSRTFLVIVSTYYNRQNHPPIPAFVIGSKKKGENKWDFQWMWEFL